MPKTVISLISSPYKQRFDQQIIINHLYYNIEVNNTTLIALNFIAKTQG